MKKQIILFLCCLVLSISGMPQSILPYQQTSSKDVNWWEPDTIYTYSTIYDPPLAKRHIFSYENGNIKVDLVQKWNNNKWENSSKCTYTYNSQNKISSILDQYWVPNEWKNKNYYTRTYNTKNEITNSSSYGWNGNWALIVEVTYTYNLQTNNLTSTFRRVALGDWMMWWTIETTYIYDEQNNIIESIIIDSFDDDNQKKNYTYDTQNNRIEELVQIGNLEQWINNKKVTYIYDAQNNKIEDLVQMWNLEQWKNDKRVDYIYDAQNKIIESLTQKWSLDQWMNLEKYIYAYDVQYNMTEYLHQLWESDQWNNDWKYSYTYDENNNANVGSFQKMVNNTWVNSYGQPVVYYNNMKKYYNLDFSEGTKFEATYIDPTSIGIQENNFLNNSIKLYPNPVSNILHIEYNNSTKTPLAKIYSIEGVLLQQSNNNQTNVSSFPSGIYIVEVNGIFQKFVKQ